MKIRSSHPEVFRKKGVLKNVVNFTGRNLCRCYLKSEEDLQPGILSRKDADISDNIFLKNILEQPHVENEQSSPIKYYQHSKYWKIRLYYTLF